MKKLMMILTFMAVLFSSAPSYAGDMIAFDELSGNLFYLPQDNAVATGASYKLLSFKDGLASVRANYAYILNQDTDIEQNIGTKHLLGADVCLDVIKVVEKMGGKWELSDIMPSVGIGVLFDTDLGISDPKLAISLSLIKMQF